MRERSEQQRRFVRFKSALTRAQRSGDAHQVLAACEAFKAYYERSDSEPYPDDWHRWQIAANDAAYALGRPLIVF